MACKSNYSDDGQPDVGAETIAAEAETWVSPCSPVDDVITSEILDNTGNPDIPESCDLASEPGGDFNKVFKRVE